MNEFEELKSQLKTAEEVVRIMKQEIKTAEEEVFVLNSKLQDAFKARKDEFRKKLVTLMEEYDLDKHDVWDLLQEHSYISDHTDYVDMYPDDDYSNY